MNAPHGLEGLRVFLVEDEIIVAIEIESVLQDEGCQVIGPAHTLREALKTASEASMDVALLDVNLNNEMTFDLAEQLMARGVPVVLATGYDNVSLPKALAALPRLSKPFTSAQLRTALLHVKH